MLPEVLHENRDEHKNGLPRQLLGRLLLDQVLRSADPDATIDLDEVLSIPEGEGRSESVVASKFVFENGPKIDLDHYIVYHAHFEYGRILRCQGKTDEAREQFELVLSGKPLEVGPSGKKAWRYSWRTRYNFGHTQYNKQIQYQELDLKIATRQRNNNYRPTSVFPI